MKNEPAGTASRETAGSGRTWHRRDFYLFAAAIAFAGFSQSVVDSTFNNFLNETFSISDFHRGMLELPRELPGFLVVFVSALLFFLSPRRLASFANILAAAGMLLIALFSKSFNSMLVWLFVFSVGQHLFLPLAPSIGMEFASEARAGRRLGQLTGAQNLAAIIGSFAVFIGFKYLNFSFSISFLIAATGYLSVALLMFMMEPDRPHPAKAKLVLRKEYRLFYWLNILYGTRKQIFLTFAPWVLVTVYKQQTAFVATLLTIGGVTGIFFKPLLGRAIDRFGERAILMGEAAVLVFVCAGYGFAKSVLPGGIALAVAAACYVLDQLLMAVGMARATYLRKIAVVPEDVANTLAMGTTIDHIFSIGIALVSGVIWITVGYQYVFLMGAGIALANLFSASRVRTKKG